MAESDRLTELERKFAENPRRYFAPLANEFRKAGDPATAIAICREQLARFPGHMSGYVVLGQALYESRQPEGARDAFARALELDPENLIALRHLGDIARDAGDGATARQWYQRVLEADPRNDDIAAQLADLGAGARMAPPAPAPEPVAFVAPGAAAPPPIEPLDWAALDLDLPAAEQGPPTAAATVAPAPDAPAPDVRDGLIEFDALDLGVGEPAAAPAREPRSETLAVSEQPGLDVTAEHELADLDEAPVLEPADAAFADVAAPDEPFVESVGWEELSLPAPAQAEVLAAPVDVGDPVAENENDDPADPSEILFDAPLPIEVANDLDPSAFAPAPVPLVPEGASVEASPGVEEEARASGEYDPVVGLDLPPADPVPAELPHEIAVVPSGPAVVAASAAAPPVTFVTETMAGLLLQQGHREQALEVYERLAAQRPDDADLRERVASLRGEPAAPQPSAPDSTAGAVPILSGAAAFFAALAGDTGTDASPADPVPPAADVPTSAGAEPATVRVFAGEASPEDERAAARLADGFANVPGEEESTSTLLDALAARPRAEPIAPPAPVLPGIVTAAAPASDAPYGLAEFSFERFFEGLEEPAQPSAEPVEPDAPAVGDWFAGATPAPTVAAHAGEPTAEVSPPPAEANAEDDLAQFNAWLKGLMNP